MFEGFQAMNFNWHLCDILICNTWVSSYLWNDMYQFVASKDEFSARLSFMQEEKNKYEALTEYLVNTQNHFISDITLYYPYTYNLATSPPLPDSVNIIRDWLNQNYPTSKYDRRVNINVILAEETTVGAYTNILQHHNLLFKQGNDTWMSPDIS